MIIRTTRGPKHLAKWTVVLQGTKLASQRGGTYDVSPDGVCLKVFEALQWTSDLCRSYPPFTWSWISWISWISSSRLRDTELEGVSNGGRSMCNAFPPLRGRFSDRGPGCSRFLSFYCCESGLLLCLCWLFFIDHSTFISLQEVSQSKKQSWA